MPSWLHQSNFKKKKKPTQISHNLSFQFVFKLTVAKQQDHFFQAAYLEERDAWVRDIKKAIHHLDGGQRFARKSTRKSIRLPETINLRFVLIALLPHLLPSAVNVSDM